MLIKKELLFCLPSNIGLKSWGFQRGRLERNELMMQRSSIMDDVIVCMFLSSQLAEEDLLQKKGQQKNQMERMSIQHREVKKNFGPLRWLSDTLTKIFEFQLRSTFEG